MSQDVKVCSRWRLWTEHLKKWTPRNFTMQQQLAMCLGNLLQAWHIVPSRWIKFKCYMLQSGFEKTFGKRLWEKRCPYVVILNLLFSKVGFNFRKGMVVRLHNSAVWSKSSFVLLKNIMILLSRVTTVQNWYYSSLSN